MKFWLLFVALVGWALWFGSTIATFAFGWHFFKVLSPDTAADAANAMFESFAIYEWCVAAIAVAAVGLLFVTFPSKRLLGVIAGLILAGGVMVTVTLGFTPTMQMLRKEAAAHHENVRDNAEWRRLHGRSMMAMSLQALLLAVTAVPLLAAADPTFRRQAKILDDAVEPVLPKRGGLSQRT